MFNKAILISASLLGSPMMAADAYRDKYEEEFALFSTHRSGFQEQQKEPAQKISFRLGKDEQDPGSFSLYDGSLSDDSDIDVEIIVRPKKGKKIRIDGDKLKKALKAFNKAIDEASVFVDESK